MEEKIKLEFELKVFIDEKEKDNKNLIVLNELAILQSEIDEMASNQWLTSAITEDFITEIYNKLDKLIVEYEMKAGTYYKRFKK
jgi:TolB-like protein